MDNKHNNDKDLKSSQSAVEDSEEEENEILEESPCGRWHKRREEVEQNNIPGIDATYLAMDTEEGVEVVWNEVRFSERKYFRAKEEIISEVFDRLIQLEHPNIVKLHKYWIHKDADIPKVVFITEYMSSGSLKQYFEKTKRHDIKISLQVWRRWCTQTLSALCYLHSSLPSIVHGNINCDTIFISYNGLIKIGAIAPDAIHRHVKTVRADAKSNLHFIAPELGNVQDCQMLSPAVDIYSFGMCALEMAALEIPSDNDAPHHITEDVIHRTIHSLDNDLQRDFIQQCLRKDPALRPTARDLLFHPIIFEVPSLRLFCAHSILNNPSLQPEQLTEEAISRLLCLQNQNDRIVAEMKQMTYKQSDFPNRELEKMLDEVKNGAFPLTAVMPTTRPPLVSRQRTISPEVVDEAHKLINTPDNPYDEETRRIVYINCSLQPLTSDQTCYDVKIVIKLDDKINRQLTCEIQKDHLVPPTISQELVYYGFINKDDKETVAQILLETLTSANINKNNIGTEQNNTSGGGGGDGGGGLGAYCEKSFQNCNIQQQKANHCQIVNSNNMTTNNTYPVHSTTLSPNDVSMATATCQQHLHNHQYQDTRQQYQMVHNSSNLNNDNYPSTTTTASMLSQLHHQGVALDKLENEVQQVIMEQPTVVGNSHQHQQHSSPHHQNNNHHQHHQQQQTDLSLSSTKNFASNQKRAQQPQTINDFHQQTTSEHQVT